MPKLSPIAELSADVQQRLMCVEQAVGKDREDFGQRITALEVKMNLIAWLSGAMLVGIISTLVAVVFHA